MSQASESIAQFVQKRGITRLVHFTPLINLIGIYEMGAILSRDKIEDYATKHNDCFLLDYIKYNDSFRYDGRRDCINLSIQRINRSLYHRFCEKFVGCDVWCILELSTKLLEHEDVVFAIGNAASTYVRNFGLGTGIEGLKALFANKVNVKNASSSYVISRSEVPENCPTDRQAEVLYPAQIPLSYVNGVIVSNDEHKSRVYAALQADAQNIVASKIKVDAMAFEA